LQLPDSCLMFVLLVVHCAPSMKVAQLQRKVAIVDRGAVVAAGYPAQDKARCEESCLEVPHKPVFEAVHQRIDRPTLL
jgi:hypothetical protein